MKAAAILLPLLVSTSGAHATVVYNSRTTSPNGIFIINEVDESSSFNERPNGVGEQREFDCRVGDVITLAGTDRFVTEFTTRLWSFAPASPITTDVELTLYQNASNLPGAVIWSGTLTGISVAGTTPIDVTFNPNVVVPDTLCFGIAFPSLTTSRAFGPLASGFVLVGSSPLYTVRQDTATQAWRQDPLGTPFFHVDARVTAVPSPGMGAVAALVLPAVVSRRRRR
jgi:hypothetical protein